MILAEANLAAEPFVGSSKKVHLECAADNVGTIAVQKSINWLSY